MISLGVAFSVKYNHSNLLFILMLLFFFFCHVQMHCVKVMILCGNVLSFAKHTKVVRHNSGLSLMVSF